MNRQTFPLLWAFIDGAFSANGGGHAKEEDFKDFTTDEAHQAEAELAAFCVSIEPRALGMQADSGYTVSGRTHQAYDDGDDKEYTLLAFELLDRLY